MPKYDDSRARCCQLALGFPHRCYGRFARWYEGAHVAGALRSRVRGVSAGRTRVVAAPAALGAVGRIESPPHREPSSKLRPTLGWPSRSQMAIMMSDERKGSKAVGAMYFKTSAEFRRWLERHHETRTELLVGYFKKSSGRPSMTWPESVDEALCFGWIDGVRNGIDDERYTIRFTPRKPGGIWSAANIKRARELIDRGLMKPAGFAPSMLVGTTDRPSTRTSRARPRSTRHPSGSFAEMSGRGSSSGPVRPRTARPPSTG
jgi:hypothetical protein